jgi:hypothetical protein
MEKKPKIYCYALPWTNGDVMAVSIAEDGTELALHQSSNVQWAKHDLGYERSKWRHEAYENHYPDGFELEWVDDVTGHEGLQAALERHRAKPALEASIA